MCSAVSLTRPSADWGSVLERGPDVGGQPFFCTQGSLAPYSSHDVTLSKLSHCTLPDSSPQRFAFECAAGCVFRRAQKWPDRGTGPLSGPWGWGTAWYVVGPSAPAQWLREGFLSASPTSMPEMPLQLLEASSTLLSSGWLS